MKRIYKSFMFIVAAAMTFTACNTEPIETPEETAGTHKVTFFASQVETKTTMEINDGIASFAWEDADKGYFHIFENGVCATGDDVDAELDNNVMTISAVFSGTSAPYSYTGFMAATVSNDNPAVSNEQLDLGTYDPKSDILVAKPVTDKTPDDIIEGILFQFKRVVAINQMTLKGLTAGETVTEVSISSDKPIAGEYDFANGAWNASGTSISITTEAVADADGHAVVYFVSAPVEGAQLTVTATTEAGKTYSKELAKTITFTEGGVKTFGVTVAKEEQATAHYEKVTSNQTDWSGRYLIVYEGGKNSSGDVIPAKAFNGGLSTLDAVGNGIDVSIENNTIAFNEAVANAYFDIKKESDDNYSITSASGITIGKTAYSNGLDSGNSSLRNSISMNEDGISIKGLIGGAALMFNYAKDQMRFRYYKTEQQDVALYKFIGQVAIVAVTGVSLEDDNVSIAEGAHIRLNATVAPDNATNKNVSWTSSDPDVATVEDGLVTAVSEGTATITVITVDGEFKDECVVTVTASSVSIANTKETAYTPSEAIAIIDAGKDLNTPVYVKGIVSKIVTDFNSQFGNISFNVSEDGKTTGNQFQFYRNFKGAEKEKWTASNAPRVGDSVIGYGKLTKYNSTYEFTEGNYIVSINRAPYLEASASKVSDISADGETVTITVDTNVSDWSASISGDSTFSLDNDNKTSTSIPVIVAANTDTTSGKTATVTITAGDKSVNITLTQSKAAGGSGEGGGVPITLTFDMSTNPGSWPTTNSTTLTNYSYTLEGTEYTFALKNVKCNSGYLMLTQPAVLGLPAISGYKLTKVVAKNSGGCSTSVNVGISSSSDSANYINGGAAQKWATQGSSYTYELSGTAVNTMYYLYVTSKNAQVTELKLTYTPVN
ncbi:MAG: Ig-like domain-containing protein [Bacteroidales bacterium]|nr:Ig-like domain-containing protein [Bacteroidales bacterium]